MSQTKRDVAAQWGAVNARIDRIEAAGGVIVEDPILEDNETFGPCVYFTAMYGDPPNAHYVEIGVKPNGEVFTVR